MIVLADSDILSVFCLSTLYMLVPLEFEMAILHKFICMLVYVRTIFFSPYFINPNSLINGNKGWGGLELLTSSLVEEAKYQLSRELVTLWDETIRIHWLLFIPPFLGVMISSGFFWHTILTITLLPNQKLLIFVFWRKKLGYFFIVEWLTHAYGIGSGMHQKFYLGYNNLVALWVEFLFSICFQLSPISCGLALPCTFAALSPSTLKISKPLWNSRSSWVNFRV